MAFMEHRNPYSLAVRAGVGVLATKSQMQTIALFVSAPVVHSPLVMIEQVLIATASSCRTPKFPVGLGYEINIVHVE